MTHKVCSLDNKMYPYKNFLEFLCVFSICLYMSFNCMGSSINLNNFVYGLEHIATYNRDLFLNNPSIGDLDNSPRSFSNNLMSFLMTIFSDGQWAEAAILILRINYLLYAIAGTYIAFSMTSQYKLISTPFIMICLLFNPLVRIAGFPINSAFNLFLGTAFPISVMGLTSGIKNRHWSSCWILLSLSTILHVHEGLWAGCIIGIIWIVDCILAKKILFKNLKFFPIYIFSMLWVILPSLFQSTPIDNEEFVSIYAFWRTPHHLILSNWGYDAIKNYILMITIPFILCVMVDKFYSRRTLISMFLLMLAILALMLEYVATVLFPNATLVSMYIPKIFKYIQLYFSLLYLSIGWSCIGRKKYLIGTFSIIVPIVTSRSSIVSKESILSFFNKNNVTSLLFTYFLCLISFYIIRKVSKLKIVPLSLLATYLLCLSFYTMVNKFFVIDDTGISYVSGATLLKNTVGENIWNISLEFKELTSSNDIFLANPTSGDTGEIQLLSQRNCYVVKKNTPSDKAAIFDWYEKIQIANTIKALPANTIADLMVDLELKYILVTKEYFDDYNNSNAFELFCGNEGLSFYKLIG